MLSFLGGGNPFGQDPMTGLAQAAQAPADPATTGATTPAAEPSLAGTISGKIGDAFSGKGLFGGSPDDAEIDPATGAPKGMARQAGMQSLMKMGLLFLAAGQNMSADSRAAILSKAPALVGGGDDQLNSFAKTRLEMAKLKLEQRKQLAEEQAGREQTAAIRELTGGAVAPSTGAQAVAGAQQGNAATAQAVGAPEAVAAAPDAANMPVPGAVPAQAGGVPPSMTGGVPRGNPPLLTRADGLGILSNPTPGGRGQALNNSITAAQNREFQGQPKFNPVTNKIEIPILNGRGQVVRTADGGSPAMTSRDKDGFREKGYTLPDGTFHVTDRAEIRDPADDEERRAITGVLKDRGEKLNEAYQTTVQPALTTYDKMRDIRAQVVAGKGVFGTGSDLVRSTMNALATAGYLDKDKLGDLNVTANFERVMKGGVAQVIKDFNGSQGVSNADREFAANVMQAAATNNRAAVVNALTNGMNDQKTAIKRYQENATDHIAQAGVLPEKLRKILTPKLVSRDLDREEADAAKAAPQAQEPSPGVVRYARDPKTGKIVKVQ